MSSKACAEGLRPECIGTMSRAEAMQGVERMMADGIGEWQIKEGNDPSDVGASILESSGHHFIAWDDIAAMTPEQREYYGLTATYKFVMSLPPEHRP